MGFRMLQPWKNPRSTNYWFRRRVPAKYAAFGMQGEVKFSLDTTDYAEAVLRCNDENIRLERLWRRNLGRTPTILSQRQIAALAGEFYRETVAAHRDNPGRQIDREMALRRHAEKKKPLIPFIVSLSHNYRIRFGDEARAFLEKRDTDENVAPNHGWRHRFSSLARHVDMHVDVQNIIQGHVGDRTAADYGDAWAATAHREISKIPRYDVL
jgi:hypothetical protein